VLCVDSKKSLLTERFVAFYGAIFGISNSKNEIYSCNSSENDRENCMFNSIDR